MESNSLTDASYWGIDVGGTFAKVGCITNGIFEMVATLPTGENCSPEKLLRDISELILQNKAEPSAVGLGTAGLVNRNEEGVIRFSPNLPLWNGINAGRIL
ncbi:MAG: ROK family protein, partial [Candidatus Sabulitectum sp.]|nr:ROK family protein [Candidatus Sabulitectum sp.]